MLFSTTLFGSYELMIFLKLLLAALAGGIIGFEREKHGRPAGLRTHLLVSAGSCLMMIISEAFFLKYGGLPGTGVVRLDPGRVAAQIVTGIGFLGAGVIIKEGFNVRGLTTAACLWLVAGIGMAFGIGMLSAGGIATFLALFSLLILKKVEPKIRKDRYLHLYVTAVAEPDIYPRLGQIFGERDLCVSNVEAELDVVENRVLYGFIITQHSERTGRELSHVIAAIEGVYKIRFK